MEHSFIVYYESLNSTAISWALAETSLYPAAEHLPAQINTKSSSSLFRVAHIDVSRAPTAQPEPNSTH